MIYDSRQWIGDVDATVKSIKCIDELANKSVLITGAAGLVCSAVVDIMIRYNETHKKKIQIILAGRWLEEMAARFGTYMQKEYISFVIYDASKSDNSIPLHSDYIIHGASNASPDMIVKEPVETMRKGLQNKTGPLYQLK